MYSYIRNKNVDIPGENVMICDMPVANFVHHYRPVTGICIMLSGVTCGNLATLHSRINPETVLSLRRPEHPKPIFFFGSVDIQLFGQNCASSYKNRRSMYLNMHYYRGNPWIRAGECSIALTGYRLKSKG